MGKLTDLLDMLINLFTRRNKWHNHVLNEMRDLSKAIEEFLVKYNLQEKQFDSKFILESIGQARIDVTTVAYKTLTRIKIVKGIKSKNLPTLLEEVHNNLEMLKRALFNPTLGNAAVDEVVPKLYESSTQLINEVSSIAYK
jgi:hypothetical protein